MSWCSDIAEVKSVSHGFVVVESWSVTLRDTGSESWCSDSAEANAVSHGAVIVESWSVTLLGRSKCVMVQ